MDEAVRTQARATFVESFAVAPETLYQVMLDHEGMSEWMGTRITQVAGPAGGGVGAVRRIHAPGIAIDEEVTYALAPRRIVYRIVKGLPVIRFHRGEILIEPWGQTGSHLTWDILMDCAVPGVAAAICAGLKGPMRRGLTKLRQKLSG